MREERESEEIEREREWHVSFLVGPVLGFRRLEPSSNQSTMAITVNRNLLQNRTVISFGLQKSAV